MAKGTKCGCGCRKSLHARKCAPCRRQEKKGQKSEAKHESSVRMALLGQ